MPLSHRTRSLLASLTSFVAVGSRYWPVPYRAVSLPGALWHPGLIVAGACALLLCASRSASVVRAATMLALSVTAAVAARGVVEVVLDPTSHSLWPIELVISFVVGLVAALPGALVGSLLAHLRPARRGTGRQ